ARRERRGHRLPGAAEAEHEDAAREGHVGGCPGARPARRSWSVVAALPALAPLLVHGCPGGLLAEREGRERGQRAHRRPDPEADDDLRLGPAEELEVVMDGRHTDMT